MLRHYTCRECGQTVATDRELRSYRCDCGGEMVFVGPFSVAEVERLRLGETEWVALACELLRLLMPDRNNGCLCIGCLQEEINDLRSGGGVGCEATNTGKIGYRHSTLPDDADKPGTVAQPIPGGKAK